MMFKFRATNKFLTATIFVSLSLCGVPKINANKSKYFIDSLNQILKQSTNDSSKVYTLVKISQSYSTYDLKSSIITAEKAIEVARESKQENLISFAIFNAGNAYFELGMYENATVQFYDYLELQKDNNNRLGEAFALSNIGAIHLKMNEHKEAKECFIKALGYLENLPEKNKQQVLFQIPNILNNLGIVYQNVGQYDSALHYYERGYQLLQKDGSQYYLKSGILNNIGGLFLETGNHDSALVFLNRALKIRLYHNDISGQAASLNALADYYFKKNKNDLALENLYKGLAIGKKIGSIDIKSRITEKLFEHYNSANNSDSALKYHMLFNDYKDSVNRESTLKELMRLELISNFKEKEKIKKIEQNRKNTIYLFVGLTLLLLYFLSSSRVRRLKLEKKNIALASKNIELEKKNLENELELRNKELTTNVMSLIRKNELIKQTIEILVEKRKSAEISNEAFITSVINDLSKIQDESIWQEFEMRYQQVHNDFYEKLQEINPSLTTNERRLCAFIRLNMTTKDVASITGQSIRSIEVARTRLRKKLNLTNSETSLVEFLTSI